LSQFTVADATKGLRVITQGENFTTEYFYRLINGSESFTKKECTGTDHQPSVAGISAAFLSIRVRREKGFQFTLSMPPHRDFAVDRANTQC
jgi:hypothetical protein